MSVDPPTVRRWSDTEVAEALGLIKEGHPNLWEGYLKLELANEPLLEVYDQIYRIVHKLHPNASVSEQALLMSMVRVRARRQLGVPRSFP